MNDSLERFGGFLRQSAVPKSFVFQEMEKIFKISEKLQTFALAGCAEKEAKIA